ncbi:MULTISPECIES: TorF family putative porin [unclassified Polynucleobacter]|uniref:TorF family putative porin n=1 Tax=unclassified Polynucleobacter TaxID=2640945 RepID=UPI001F28BA25|nr:MULTISPECIES: TorF family putative porin [unclassified Polynucleobacter]MCE7526458.1 TorF family putative porin [Polynucleobacter sp. IMCC 30228]MCE7529744.1 TorF family putative porin [Polynucleobacter sp. IMCC 29146]
MKTFHKSTIALAVVGLLSANAYAQNAASPNPTPLPAEPAGAVSGPDISPITANVTVANNYIYRGISQSNFNPAIQGGFDYAHPSGFYIGNWNSSISWISDAASKGGNNNVSAPIEMDFYAGFKKEFIGEGFMSDLGVLQYYYPTQNYPSSLTNPNTTELYAAQNYVFGPVSGFLKFSYAVTNTFGFSNSSGSYYPDLTANYDTGLWGLVVNAHVGYQYIAGQKTSSTVPTVSYTDWKIGLSKDLGGGLGISAAYIGTNAASAGGNYAYSSPTGKNLGGSQGLVTLTKVF